jgi:A/G-specific adenine glycosylase
MTAVPTTPWLVDFVDQGDLYSPEKGLDWEIMPRQVKHTFTHFHLQLTVKVAVSHNSSAGIWASRETLETVALPTLMKKVIECVPDGFSLDPYVKPQGY